ncbi:PHP domain-containing protein [Granulicoccus sp. GXG6511]|uniref:PHP domain-containing protein n=1 Tax=Granulicoccus sp. GXG6511 TaxID=3381351 RepID=UPI003D7C833D
MRIDLHSHTTVSDGTDTPDELLALARAIGLDVLGVTDHDTFEHLPAVRAAARREGIELLEGMELSCEFEGKSVHLLAYGMDPDNEDLLAEMARIRDGRADRLPRMLERLADLGVPVTEAEVMAHVGEAPSIGRPHIADALVSRGHVASRDEAFQRFLADDGPAYIPRYHPDVRTGIELVHAAGGLAIIAHPWGRSSVDVLTESVLADLVDRHGLDGFEIDHEDHGDEQRRRLRALASDLGALGTGSSDHHGTGKPHMQLGCNLTDPAVYAELLARLG